MVSQTSGVLVFGVVLIIAAIIAVSFFVVGLSRRTNQRHQTDEISGERNIPRDPTASKRVDDIEDTTGNFSRSVSDKQDINKNART